MAQKTRKNKEKPAAIDLLGWYDQHRREMPWRAKAGRKANAYHVWLSEIMLQQTTVATVGPYFLKFIARWPDLRSLAKADLDEILRMWAGLGYYRRARGLHECAAKLIACYDGKFPQTESELLSLPGIGPYTASAILSIAFDRPANVVDGNVERVMARLFSVKHPMPQAKKKLKELALSCLPESRFGDYAQALMDLGATVCTPRSPKCGQCPWSLGCSAFQCGDQQNYPVRAEKKRKPTRHGFAFVLFNKNRRLLLRKRPSHGLLASMMGVPTTIWQESEPIKWSEAKADAPIRGSWRILPELIHHTFTHFELELNVAVATSSMAAKGKWVEIDQLGHEALPSVMRKVLSYALAEERHKTRGSK